MTTMTVVIINKNSTLNHCFSNAQLFLEKSLSYVSYCQDSFCTMPVII